TLQKCTELGAAAFQPVWSDRVEVRLKGEKLARRLEHWRGVVTAACEQSGRARVPEVFTAKALADWAREPGEAVRLVLAPRAGFSLASLAPASDIELAVGPEGGFSESEVRLLEQHGVRPVSLGPRVLRTETAAPAAIAALQTLFGDFR
ncbi:MAG: RsmE family RNA methyltransferase, partial [Lysobacterales bacterium]